MKNFKNLIDPKSFKYFIYIIFLNIFIYACEFVSIASIYPLLIILTKDNQPKILINIINFLKIEKDNLLFFFITVLLIFLFLKNILLIIFNFIIQNFILKNYNYISNRVIKNILSLNYLEIINLTSPIFIRNCKEIVISVRSYLLNKIFLFSEIILIIVIASLLFLISFNFTIVSFFILLMFYLILNFISRKRLFILGKKRNEIYANINNSLIEIFNSFRELKIYSQLDLYLNHYKKRNVQFSLIQKKIEFFSSITRYLFEIIIVLFLFFLFFFNLDKINISLIPIFGVFVFAFFRLYPSFVKILYIKTVLTANQDSINIIQNFIHPKNNSEENINKNIIKFENNLELRNINFSYNKEHFLKNINLIIYKGNKIGITGKNGSGKTTLCNIILSLIKPNNGDVLIDGKINIFDNLYSYRNLISFIPQNIFLLNDTVENNIIISGNNLNQDKLDKVLEITKLNELILDLKRKNKNTIGENGNNLSGGQRQRIAIARAIYRDSEIIIMDEHTNSLDAQIENELILSSKELFKNKTLVVVSHKKEVLSFCNDIYLLEKGELQKL